MPCLSHYSDIEAQFSFSIFDHHIRNLDILLGRILHVNFEDDILLVAGDRFEVDDVTLTEFLRYFDDKGLTVNMVSSGVSLLYASFYPPSKVKDRMPMK